MQALRIQGILKRVVLDMDDVRKPPYVTTNDEVLLRVVLIRAGQISLSFVEVTHRVACGACRLDEDARRQWRQLVPTAHHHLPRRIDPVELMRTSDIVAAHGFLQRNLELHQLRLACAGTTAARCERHLAGGASSSHGGGVRGGELRGASLLVLHERGLVQRDLRLEELDVVDGLLEHGHRVHLAAAGDEAAEHAEAVADPVPPLARRHALRVRRELCPRAPPHAASGATAGAAHPAVAEGAGRRRVVVEIGLLVDHGETAWVIHGLVVIWIHG